jgi:hypothetical protein
MPIRSATSGGGRSASAWIMAVFRAARRRAAAQPRQDRVGIARAGEDRGQRLQRGRDLRLAGRQQLRAVALPAIQYDKARATPFLDFGNRTVQVGSGPAQWRR